MGRGEFTVVIDTREQRPYEYRNSVVDTLETGDYSIRGMEQLVVIERKSHHDIFGTIGRGRDRFRREFERMSVIPASYVLIEQSLGGMCTRPFRVKMNPSAVINTLISWQQRYGVHVVYADSRPKAKLYAARILQKAWKNREELIERKNKLTGRTS